MITRRELSGMVAAGFCSIPCLGLSPIVTADPLGSSPAEPLIPLWETPMIYRRREMSAWRRMAPCFRVGLNGSNKEGRA
jgi:hypothetical protein